MTRNGFPTLARTLAYICSALSTTGIAAAQARLLAQLTSLTGIVLVHAVVATKLTADGGLGSVQMDRYL